MEPNKTRLHPLLSIAAISVSIFSLVGIGALTGLLPHSLATKPDAAPVSASTSSVPAGAPQASVPQLVEAAASSPEQVPSAPATRPATRKSHATPKPAPAKVAEATVPSTLPPPVPAAVPVAAPIAAAPVCGDCGMVENFRQIEVAGQGSGVGAVAGGATGAIIGHQFGRGTGKDLLTIAGAIGGAFAGHQIEKSARKTTRYEITVRMEDGSLRTVSQDAVPAWHIGDRVRVVNNQLVGIS